MSLAFMWLKLEAVHSGITEHEVDFLFCGFCLHSLAAQILEGFSNGNKLCIVTFNFCLAGTNFRCKVRIALFICGN